MACTLPLRNTAMSNEPLKESQFFKTNLCELRMFTVRCMLVWKCLHVTQHHTKFLCTTNTLKTGKWVTVNRVCSLKLLQTHPTVFKHHHIKNHSTHFAEDWIFKAYGPVCEALTFFWPSGWRKCWGTQQPNHIGTKLPAPCNLRPPDCWFSPSSTPDPIFSVLFSC